MTDGRLSYHGGAHVEQLRGNRDIPASNSTCARLADPYETDGVANLKDIDTLYETVAKHNRKLDVVFANAGVSQIATFGAVDENFFDLYFDANVKGLFFTVQKALPLLNGGAAIILNASIARIKGFPGISVYSASKAAVRSFVRSWTNELRDRANAMSPGHIDTRFFESWRQDEALTKMKEDHKHCSSGQDGRSRRDLQGCLIPRI